MEMQKVTCHNTTGPLVARNDSVKGFRVFAFIGMKSIGDLRL